MAISQREQVLTHLKKGLPITSWEAIQQFRITRLSAVIYDLRQAGYTILSQKIITSKKLAKSLLLIHLLRRITNVR